MIDLTQFQRSIYDRPAKVHPDDVPTVVTLAEMREEFFKYFKLRKVSRFRHPIKEVNEWRQRKLEYYEMRFPAFKAAYDKETAR